MMFFCILLLFFSCLSNSKRIECLYQRQIQLLRKNHMTKLTLDDLKKKQSVRATFKLPQQTISLLSMVARQLGVKQKSLFDQLIDNPAVLTQVIQDSREFAEDQKDRQQKTFVISRDSLTSINTIAKQENISRDLLVEISISRLLPIIDKELERHKKRKKILADMKKHQLQGKRILSRADKLLGSDDQLSEMLRKQVKLVQRDISEIEALIEQGTAMERW